MIAGVPSWTLVLLKRILELSGAGSIYDIWPNLELFVHGGVSFKPYRAQFDKLLGDRMKYLETYNASEGFFALQDQLDRDDLLLMLDYGIFYEFIPMSEWENPNPRTIGLAEVELGQNYALVISTNAGLWRYVVGDTVKFTSRYPFRIQVSGRTRHYINAFGEELMVENADEAIRYACEATGAHVTDYTGAPVYMTEANTGGHEWLVEFDQNPTDMNRFAECMDKRLREVNSDYDAKRAFDFVLRAPVIQPVPQGTFYQWLKGKGKLGGQHKVPRLSNDRIFLEEVLNLLKVEQ
jgi:hypothetical protein